MITITTCLARQLRAMFRRALRLTSRDVGPELVLCAGPDGLRVRAQNSHAAVEHHTPGGLPFEQIRVPFALFADCEGPKAERVSIEQEAGGGVVVQWTDKKIPQLVRYDGAVGEIPVFPPTPETMAQVDNGLWRALADATQTTVSDSIRFATDCLQLRGQGGKIVATNGEQLLVQTGFNFPWEGDVLVPRNSLFTYRDLPTNVPLFIGRSDKWLTLKAGAWTFHLAIDTERRFPRTDEIIQRPETAVTRLTLEPADAAFLADALERMPCKDDDMYQAVTMDLNGQVIEGVVKRVMDSWDQAADVESMPFASIHESDVLRQQTIDLVTAYLQQSAAVREFPLAVETSMESPLIDPDTGEDLGIPLTGIVDLVLDDRDGPLICDFKTAAKSATPFEVTHEIQLSSYAYLYRQAAGRKEGNLEIRSLIKTKAPKIEFHRYRARSDVHFRRLFAVIRAYLDDLDANRFVFRPGFGCAICDYRDGSCRNWAG